MSKNNSLVPQARTALDQFKMDVAREVALLLFVRNCGLCEKLIQLF